MEEKKWYVVNTYSGHENKVKEKLEMRAESMGLQDYIFRVIVPEQTVVEEKDGVTKEKVKTVEQSFSRRTFSFIRLPPNPASTNIFATIMKMVKTPNIPKSSGVRKRANNIVVTK